MVFVDIRPELGVTSASKDTALEILTESSVSIDLVIGSAYHWWEDSGSITLVSKAAGHADLVPVDELSANEKCTSHHSHCGEGLVIPNRIYSYGDCGKIVHKPCLEKTWK